MDTRCCATVSEKWSNQRGNEYLYGMVTHNTPSLKLVSRGKIKVNIQHLFLYCNPGNCCLSTEFSFLGVACLVCSAKERLCTAQGDEAKAATAYYQCAKKEITVTKCSMECKHCGTRAH